MRDWSRIYCVECDTIIKARLTNGAEIYPHRPDLQDLPFWICDSCKNSVGTHHKSSKKPQRPLGVIANPNLKKLRMEIHSKLDPMWRNGKYKRKELYRVLSNELGRKYHTADLRNLREATEILLFVEDLATQPSNTEGDK